MERNEEIGTNIREKIIINRFKEAVEEYKNKNNVSYKDIADKLNMSSQSLTNYTTSRVPNIDILTNVCNTFNLSLDYLCGLSNIKDMDNSFKCLGLNQNSINYLIDINKKQSSNLASYISLLLINKLFDNNSNLVDELVNMILSKFDVVSLDNFNNVDSIEKYLNSSKKKKIRDINTYLIAKDIEEFIDKLYVDNEREINSIM